MVDVSSRATGVLVIAVLMFGCQSTPTDPAAQYGGSAEVYNRIARETDCATLQDEFDVAADANDRAEPGTDQHRWSLGYMKAAEARMQSLAC
jgi:hypothetical protein